MNLLIYSISQWARYPEMRARDAYKWLYHAVMGAEHAVANVDAVRDWLDREWEQMGEAIQESLIEPLRPDGKIIRLHLRPYKQSGGDKGKLLEAFLQSAAQYRSDLAPFLESWQQLGERLQQSPLGKITFDDYQTLNQLVRANHYPAVHHSEEYEAVYHPAYRVLAAELWQ